MAIFSERLTTATLDLVVSHLVESAGLPDAHSPDEMLAAVEAADASLAAAEDSLREWVHAARRAGASWQAIGDRLGSSRQAAQQRFGAPSPSEPTPAPQIGQRLVVDFQRSATVDRLIEDGWTVLHRAYPYAVLTAAEATAV